MFCFALVYLYRMLLKYGIFLVMNGDMFTVKGVVNLCMILVIDLHNVETQIKHRLEVKLCLAEMDKERTRRIKKKRTKAVITVFKNPLPQDSKTTM